ncbi:SRPBCC family protein [Pseudarthrobacter sp. J47]|uniref:SRPBCC family protein n=2 Tax=unclassified Pseudarthrobacter TaxID=2647000 RepID=UPI002E800BEE|nr:SRPBCC family protein [Pseudarthrobacter sp. J47]
MLQETTQNGMVAAMQILTVDESIDLTVPVGVAYNQWTQFESFPRFATVVKEVNQIRPNLSHWVIGVGPWRHEFDAEIVDQLPDSLVAWRSLDRRFKHGGKAMFRTVDPENSTLTVRLQIEPHGLPGLISQVPGLAQRVVQGELRQFKEFIESVGQEGGAWRGVIRNGHVLPSEPEPPRSRVPRWPVG